MLNQFEATQIKSLVEKLKSKGVNIDEATVKNAIANFPQVVQKIEAILTSNEPDRLTKIKTLLTKAASGELTGETTK